MTISLTRALRLAAVALIPLAIASQVRLALGKDYLLTIGGGYSPLGNQVSMERNVLYVRDVVTRHLPDARHDIFFSDGKSPGRDVQIRSSIDRVPRPWKLLAQVFQQERNWGLEYRSHMVTNVQGAATLKNVSAWFDDVARTARAGDRVFVYVTAHGGKPTSGDPRNTEIYLWNNQRLNVVDFTKSLDKLSPQVNVVLVMTQCHGGGFANAIFESGMPNQGLSAAARAGFFATRYDRPASGCTTDVDGDNEHEYSSYFWAALSGRSRDGSPLAAVDYDGDGATSLAEAHTFAVIQAQSVDIPIRTSETLLRQAAANMSNAAGPYSVDAPYEQLLALAGPIERAAMDELSSQLALSEYERAKQVRDLASETAAERVRVEESQKKLAGEMQAAAQAIRASLINRWPEMANAWSPRLAEIVTADGALIEKAVESHASYRAFADAHDELERLAARRLDLNRRFAKTQRLLGVMESVVLAANLPSLAPSDIQQRYRQMLTQENQPFSPLAMAKPAAPELR